MAKELQKDFQRQDCLLGLISRTRPNVKKLGSKRITKAVLQAKLEGSEKYWTEFSFNHTELVSRADPNVKASNLYFVRDHFSKAEDVYVLEKGSLLDRIAEFVSQKADESFSSADRSRS